MKKIVLKIILVALTLGIVSCEDSDNTIDGLLDDVITGAFIRTLDDENDELNLNDPSSTIGILVEEQDEEFGGLFASLDIYVIFDGDITTEEALLTTYTPSDATETTNGLPGLTLGSSFAEMLSATGVDASEVFNNDKMELRLVLNLTDGRSYTNTDNNNDVINGEYFSSPMEYTVRVKDL